MLAHQRHPLIRPLFAIGRPLYRHVIGPLWQAVAPQARFLWERVTPGDLGLELTTAVATAAAGGFVFVLYVFELEPTLEPTPLDNELLEMSDRLHAALAVDLAQVLSALGSLPAVGALVAVTCVILAVRGRVAEILVLALGLGLTVAIVHITKAAIDRPRPPDPLVEASLSSFPSGHAAYATAWIAVALVLGSRRMGLLGNTAWALGAVALVAAIGLSRIYLRVHYWSDVAAGWAVGAGTFGLLAAIALVVEYIRHNGGEDEPERSRAARGRRRTMTDLDLTTTEIAIALAGGLVFACYVALILVPAWRCYGRLWEKLAASVMTLFILAALLGAGVAIGLAVVWTYDQYA